MEHRKQKTLMQLGTDGELRVKTMHLSRYVPLNAVYFDGVVPSLF